MRDPEEHDGICSASAEHEPAMWGTLFCNLPVGHDGPHYDRADDMSWRTIVTEGKPGEPIGQETPR